MLAGNGAIAELPRAERADIDAVTFRPIGRDETMTWEQSLDANYTDSILMLHRGRIVYERYFGVAAAERQHIAFSVTKSFVATLAATLVDEGVLDDGRDRRGLSTRAREERHRRCDDSAASRHDDGLVVHRGLRGSKVAGLGSDAGRRLPRAAAGLQRRRVVLRVLRHVDKARPHGEVFAYKTVNTDVLGAVLRRVTGKPLSDLLSERIFARLGAEHDAYFTVDPTGAEFAGGGLNLTLRDLARFGEAMRLGGRYNGAQIVPRRVVENIQRGGNREHFAPAGYATLPGWSYREHVVGLAQRARRLYGARHPRPGLYIDPAAEMVIARFASNPIAGNVGIDPTSLPAYAAVAALLMGQR